MLVNTSQEPYDSALSSWDSGMNAVERLICGTPQRVQEIAGLLAISVWDLYPNMQVLPDHTKGDDPGDDLIARSTITLSSHRISDTKERVQ